MQQWEFYLFETRSSWPIWSGQLSSFPVSTRKNDKYCVFRLLLKKQTLEPKFSLVELALRPLAHFSCPWAFCTWEMLWAAPCQVGLVQIVHLILQVSWDGGGSFGVSD